MNKKQKFIKFMKLEINKINCDKKLKEAIYYSLISEGKYIRPLLFLTYLEDNGLDYTKYFDIAMSIEMVHTYSLIHDDMPCIDNDDYRRGRQSTHKKFGENIALLTGDALLTNAFSLLLNNNIDDHTKVLLVKKLSTYAGYEGMVDGQIKDIINNIVDINDVKEIHLKKTSLLISFALEAASLVVGDKKEEEVSNLASIVGLLYQIQDDYLDEYGQEDILGKTQGKDLNSGKKTYAYFYPKEKLLSLIEVLNLNINKDINLLGEETKKIIDLIIKRKK